MSSNLLLLIVILYCSSLATAWRLHQHKQSHTFGLNEEDCHHHHHHHQSSSPRRLILAIRGGEIIQATTLEQIETILEDNTEKLVVIDFTSQNCPPCKKVAPLYEELSESEEFEGKVVFLKVDVDENPDAVSKYGVTGWPTFVFVKKGEVQAEVIGGKLAEATLYDWVKLLMPKEEKAKQE